MQTGQHLNTVKGTPSFEWKGYLGLCVLGMLSGLAHAPFSLLFILFLTIPFAFWLIAIQSNARSAFGLAWIFATGYFVTTLNWLVEPFLVDAKAHAWMAPFALIAMSGGLALFWATAFGLAHRFFTHQVSRVLMFAVFLALAEYVRAFIWTGFSWGMVSQAFVDVPLGQLGAIIGPYGTNLILFLILGLPVIFFPRVWQGASLGLAILGVLSVLGMLRVPDVDTIPKSETLVRIIQPNAAQKLKWDREFVDFFFEKQLDFAKARTLATPDIIVLPETALFWVLGEEPQRLELLSDAAGGDTYVFTGIRRRENGEGFNSSALIDPNGGVGHISDKHHLVPFGEYIPLRPLAEFFGLQALADNMGGFSRGTGPKVIDEFGIPAFLPMICYEAIFPRDARHGSKRPQWLVHITNDAWFGSFSGPFQHLAQVKMRAIEQGLPIARAANTGVSGMIDPYGRLTQSIGLGASGFEDAYLPKPLRATLYSKAAEWPWLIIALAIGLWCFLRFDTSFRRASKKED